MMIISNNQLLKQLNKDIQMQNESLENRMWYKCKQYTINAQNTISIDCPKKKLKGDNCMKTKGDCPDRVHSDQMVLGTVRHSDSL
jgi:hypothetical protein